MRNGTGVLAVLALAGGLAGCGAPARVSGGDLAVRFQVLENGEFDGAFRSRCRLILENRGDSALPASGWSLFFNSPPILLATLPDTVRARHVNGDFYRLDPGDSFAPVTPGESREIEFRTAYTVINRSVSPSGFYIVWDADGASASSPESLVREEAMPFTLSDESRRSPLDQIPIPTAESRFAENSLLSALPSERPGLIVPTPRSWRGSGATVQLDGTVQVRWSGQLDGEAAYLSEALTTLLGAKIAAEEGQTRGTGAILLRTNPAAEAESYRLSIEPARGVEIVGGGGAGVFYGIQSLLALAPPDAFRAPRSEIEIPAGLMEDSPRFGYRGMHLDVARNFQSAGSVMKFLDVMASYKLNRFHFHLSDDEGWRLPVAELPELTEVGGRRGHTLDESDRLIPSYGSGPFPDPALSTGSGSYTRAEFVEILRHARALHIEVIPEIDLPGHARAAIKSMQARRRRLLEQGDAEGADRYLLNDPDDASEYRSVQHFDDNVVNVCRESTYRFVEAVVDHLGELYREAGVELKTVHVGGDEVPAGVWEKSPECNRFLASEAAAEVGGVEGLSVYFLDRVHDILRRRGLTMGGWEEIAEAGMGEGDSGPLDSAWARGDARAYVWNSVWGWGGEENAYRLANAGFPVVLCNASNLYFDLAYSKDPEEPGQAWAGFVDTRKAFEFAPSDLYKSARTDSMGRRLDSAAYADAVRLSARGRENVLGIQGQLWAEVAKGSEIMEYLAFPKMLGLAERAWARTPDWEREERPEERERLFEADWNRFVNLLGRRELPRLDGRFGGVGYRLPPPGAKVEDGSLLANSSFPGLQIRYTIDGTEPTLESPLWSAPVLVSGAPKLKTFDTRGRSSRSSVPSWP